MKLFLFFFSVSLTLFGCAYRYDVMPTLNMGGPALSGQAVNFSDYQCVSNNVTSTDVVPIVLIFPLTGSNQDLSFGMIDNAIQKACKENGYDFMANIRVYNQSWYAIFFGAQIYVIKGDGWKKVK